MSQADISSLINIQKKSVDFFYQNLNLPQLQKIIATLQACKGKIIFSGMGKSGFVAQKLASTFLSIGKQALFLSPAEAMHGDLGAVSKEDIYLAISKSGQTKEILQIIPFIKRKGAFILSFLSDKKAPLKEESDLCLQIPLLQELCPFDLAPTTSCTLQMAVGDIITAALMQKSQMTMMDYSTNHPGGMIGNSTLFQVEEVMLSIKEMPIAYKEDKLIDRLCELTEKKCGCLIVIDKNRKLQGIFTDGDLRRSIQQKGSSVLQQTIEKLMITQPKYIRDKAKLIDAIRLMEKTPSPVTVLPVLDSKSEIVGIIRMHDIIQRGLGR